MKTLRASHAIEEEEAPITPVLATISRGRGLARGRGLRRGGGRKQRLFMRIILIRLICPLARGLRKSR